MDGNLFPKKISVAAVILTFMFLVINSMMYYRLSEQFQRVYTHHIPILEMNAINIRFGESLTNITRQLAYEYDEDLYLEYNLQKSSLKFNIETYKEAIKNTNQAAILPEDFSRSELNDLEEKIIHYSKKNREDVALDLFESAKYQELDFKYKDTTQIIAENLTIERDKILKRKVQFFKFGVIFSIGFFLVLSLLWYQVINLYRKNTLQKLEAEKELNDERIKSSHNAKMASLGEMAAGLAHEVNNPLAIISGYAEALVHYAGKEKPNIKKMEQISIKMLATTHRVAQIIKGLKSFSRNSTNDKYTPVVLSDIIDETLVFCKERFRNSGINLERVENDQNIYVDVRSVEISQVILNCLNNAYDAITCLDEENMWIKIIVTKDDKEVTLSIIDGGDGIDHEIAHKILEPFFTTKGVNKGTGLGLSISKNIINKHGGKFEIDHKHKNTKFDITLPLSKNVVGISLESVKKAA